MNTKIYDIIFKTLEFRMNKYLLFTIVTLDHSDMGYLFYHPKIALTF